MAARKITLHCDVPVRDIICSAIRSYALAAYPEGGSECAQVARYTLQTLAVDIESGITEESLTVAISKRPRAMIKAAFEYYFNSQDERQGTSSVRQRALLAGVLDETPLTLADLRAAAEKDQGK